MIDHEKYMHRCLELALLGSGHTAPNPLVGAVLVHEGQIIGEGWHQKYGEAHAEVNCINQAIGNNKQHLFKSSTLYVNLEPCAHFGKTPPCADLIVKHGIPRVVIGCEDPFKEVSGKGITKLKAAGVEVVAGILEKESKELNKRFLLFHALHRPYIILKWAETADGFIANTSNGSEGKDRLFISNEYTNRLVHKWRSEEAAILVGTNTALRDDPALNTRLWQGPSPIRLVVDLDCKLPATLRIFDGSSPTIVFNTLKHGEENNILYYQVTSDTSLVHQVLNALYQRRIISVLVEGGAKLLQSFLNEGCWDEIRKIENRVLKIQKGLPAPTVDRYVKEKEFTLQDDTIKILRPPNDQ